jgi:hypothetical protein
MDDVPRYGASRSDHRWPDRESSARHPGDASLLKLERIISRDEAFLAIGRDTASRYASPSEEAFAPAPDHDAAAYDWPEYDLPEFDANAPIVDASEGRSPHEAACDPADLDWDDRGAREESPICARQFTSNDDGLALSELARLVGRIDSFLAAGSTRTGRFEPTPGRRVAANDGVDDDAVDDDDARDTEMPVPSRHDRLTNDTDDPGLSLYAPRRKRRAAFVIARTDQPEKPDGEARRASEDRPSAPRGRARSHAARQSDYGDDSQTRTQQWRRPPTEPAPQRRGGRLLTATALLAFTATAVLYGYRTWADAGSNHPGPIAAQAAPVGITSAPFDPAAVDTSTNSVGPSTRGVWSDLTGLLAPGTALDGAASARMVAGERSTAATMARPQAHRSPTARAGARVGNIVPIANAGVSASTNATLPCEAGAARSSC